MFGTILQNYNYIKYLVFEYLPKTSSENLNLNSKADRYGNLMIN